MYTHFNNFQLSGRYRMRAWQQGAHSWAAYSVYEQKADHELYLPHTLLSIVVKGSKRMYHGRQVHHLRAGDVLLVPAGSLFCSEILWQQQEYESINLVLPHDLLAACMPAANIPAVAPVGAAAFRLATGPEWQQLQHWLLQCFLQPPASGPAPEAVTARVLQLVAVQPEGPHILAMLLQAAREASPAVQAIARELPALRRLDEVALQYGMSKASLKRHFRKLYNSAPMSWIWEKRLERAGFLLRTTHQPIKEIAYSTGFEDITHFYRAFRASYGLTPAEWRTGHPEPFSK